MTFGEVVALYLKRTGMNQSELARRIGTGRQTVNSIIRDGRRGPTLDTAAAIAVAFGVTLDEMIREMEEDADE